jgi:hypothetical protein
MTPRRYRMLLARGLKDESLTSAPRDDAERMMQTLARHNVMSTW